MQAHSFGRVRWAAIGAAIAVSLGAGGFGLIHATAPNGAVAFVPITPCRLFDTRPDLQVGPRGIPLGPNETYTLAATGPVGNCNLPTTASGIVLNITALGATAPTFLTVWPAGNARPTAAALNPEPGAPPIPNAVTTGLGPGGQFSVYNLQGNVHVVADVVGYYTDHSHDDRYYTKAQVDAAIAAAVAPRPTSPILLRPHDFSTAGLWSTGYFLAHASGGTISAECISARVDVPVGASIKRVDLTLRQRADSTTADVRISGYHTNAGEGGLAYRSYLANTGVPIPKTNNDFAVVPVAHEAADLVLGANFSATVVDGFIPALVICTTSEINITAVRVHFDP